MSRLVAEQRHLYQSHHRLRRLAVAVDELVDEVELVLVACDVHYLLVEVDSLVEAGDVVLGDMRVYLYVHEALGHLLGLLALLLGDSLREELQVHIVADSFHVSVLTAAEYASRAAYLEVAQGYAEAAAELRELAHGIEALCCYLGQHLVAAVGEICVAAAVGASHAPAELIQLRESEAVGVLDDEGVDVGDVHARLDDSRADEYVYLVLDKLLPYVGHLVLAHLTVCHGDSSLGEKLLQSVRAGEYALDAVVYVVDLSASAELAHYRLHDRADVVLDDIGLHGVSVLRRLLEHRHIAYAAHRHIERARDRCRGQHEDVHAREALLELFLVSHAEALLLVDYGKSEVLELHAFLYYLVSADEEVYASLRKLLDYLRLLLRRAVAAEQLHIDRKVLKAAQSRLIVLIREDRRRREDSALLAREYALHRRAECDLGLAEADVSAEQSLHRTYALHISLYLGDSGKLVVRLDVGKALLEVVLYLVVGIECEALAFLALRVEGDELVSHVLDSALDVAAGLLPLARAELVQLHAAVVARTDVLRHHIELSYGYVELVRARVLNGDVVLDNAVEFELANADESPDSVCAVYDEVALGDVRETAYLLRLVLLAGLALADGVHSASLRDEHSPVFRVLEAAAEAARHQRHTSRAELETVRHDIARNARVLQVLTDYREGLLTARAEQYAVLPHLVVGDVLDELFQLAAPECGLHSLEADEAAEVDALAALHEVAHVEAWLLLRDMLYLRELEAVAVQPLAELTVLHEHLDILVIARSYARRAVHHVRVVAEEHRSVDVVENRRGLAVDEGVILHSVREYLPCPQSADVRAEVLANELHALAASLLAELLYLVRELCAVVEHLARGGYLRLVELHVRAALSVRLELGNALYLVAPQLDTQGLVRLHGEDVDDVAADGELRGSLDLLRALIAAPREGEAERVAVYLLPCGQLDARRDEDSDGDNGLHYGFYARADDAAFAVHRPRERRHAHILVLAIRAVYGRENELLRREQHRCFAARHHVDIIAEFLRLSLAARDDKVDFSRIKGVYELRPVYMRKTRHGDG